MSATTSERSLAGAAWMAAAACRDAPRALFVSDSEGTDNLDPAAGPVDDEAWVPPAAAVAFCHRCPVLVECLDDAILQGAWGTWGATSRHQRRQLRRPRRRRNCPVCTAPDIISLGQVGVCASCGMSWRTAA